MAQTVSLNVGDVSGMDMTAFFRNRDLVHAAVASLNDGFKAMQERVERTGRAVGQMVKGLEGVVSALMHVASAEEGLDAGMMNLYRWSKLFGRSFSNALDWLATDALYLKNSLAAMAAPLTQTVTPAVNAVTERFAGLFNIVNQTVARLSGASSYVAARRTADAWDSVGGRIRRASAAVRRCIAGFDQLNVLYAGSSGASSGASGGFADMFEERRIDGGLAAFVDQMKAAFEAADWKSLGAMLGGKVNAFVEGVDWKGVGERAGFYLNGAIATAGHLLEAVHFDTIGERIGDFLNSALGQIDFATAGATVARFFTSAVETFAGFAGRFDWRRFAEGAAEGVNGFVRQMGEKLDAVDWRAIAARLTDGLNAFIRGADWKGLGGNLAGRVNDLFAVVGTAAARFDWSGAGSALSDGVNGFFRRIDWEGIGRWFDRTVKGVLDFALAFLRGFDAKGFARGVERALGQVDWNGIAAKLWSLLATALSKLGELGGSGGLLGRLFGDSSRARDALSRLWKELFGGETPSLSVGVDFMPNVPDGKKYENGGLLKWLQAVLAPGADAQTRVELIRQGWQSVAAWVKTLLGGGVDKAVGLARGGWQSVAAWVQSLTGGSVDKGIGLTRRGWQTVAAFVQALTGGGVDKAVGLTRGGWQTVGAWVQGLTGGNVDKGIGLTRRGWQTVAAFVQGQTGGGVDKAVGLTRGGWQSVAGWIASLYMGGSVNKGVGVNRDGFATIADWIKSLYMGGNVSKGVGVMRDGFTTVAAWIASLYMGGGVSKGVGVIRDGFTTLADWIKSLYMGGNVSKGVELMRDGFETVAGWIRYLYMGGSIAQLVELAKHGWTWVDSWSKQWAQTPIAQLVELARHGWTWVDGWSKQYAQTPIAQLVELAKKGWDWVNSWSKQYAQTPIQQLVELAKKGWTWVDTWTQQFAQTPITQYVNLAIGKVATGLKNALALLGITFASGGVITAGGSVARFASGGVIRGGAAKWWNGIPKYAAGTSRAHGTMFVAGEAGPEIVGHINGRTEILNKSQLAQTMYSAVTSGMLAALKGIEFRVPAMATGSVMPYEVSAQIAKSTADLQGTLDANNEDLIQTIISVAGQIVGAVNALQAQQRQGAGGLNAQQVINEINRRTLMGLQPLRGV